MHSRIFELSTTKIPDDGRLDESSVPEGFFGPIADSLTTIEDGRDSEIEKFAKLFGGECELVGGKIKFTRNAKSKYFANLYESFLKSASLLQTATFEAFTGGKGAKELSDAVYYLNEAYSDKWGIYIYDRGELLPLSQWLRETKLSRPFYIGGIIDYHFL